MPDLMTETYTYNALAQKYGNFCVPLIRIKKNGTDLVSSMKLSIVDITAALSLDAAGMVVFKIGGVYEEKNHSFDSGVKSAFTLGTILEVELGYLSSSLNIFKGYVAMAGAEFSETPLLVITLMDVRRLMMVSGERHMLHEVVNYSDAFKQVMEKYSKLCSLEVDATDDNLENPLSQMKNDYLFVTQELIKNGKTDREFFALGNKAYFRKPEKVKQPVMTMQYGRELLAIKTDEEYQDVIIEVIGCDRKAQNVIHGSAAVVKNSSQKKIIAATQACTLADPSADTQKKADERAKSIAAQRERRVRIGKGITIGLPELVPGRFVSVELLENDYGDHKYYIRSVVHEIRNDSFQTVFEIGGWT